MSVEKAPLNSSKPLIIFDLDGVLVNSLTVMRLAFEAALREELNPDIDHTEMDELFTQYRQHLGKGFHKIMEAINLPLSLYPPFRRHSQYLQAYVYLYPGIRTFLSDLTQYQCYLSIVTGKDTERATALLKQLGIDEYFNIITGTDGKLPGKPAPDLLLQQMRQLQKPANEVIMIGDAMSDIGAANNAGVSSCGALWGYGSRKEIAKEQPTYLASKPHDLLAVIQGHFSLIKKK